MNVRLRGWRAKKFLDCISRSLLQFIDEPIFSVQRSITTSNRARLTLCRSVEHVHEWLSLLLEDIGTSE